MKNYPDDRTFLVAEKEPCNVEETLRKSEAEILLDYLPVGSEEAARFYARCCLNTGVSFINCIPVFIVSDPEWKKQFKEKGIPIIGDDIKDQLGATILHRALARLFTERGIKIDRTYQLNTGGNTDFLNMLNQNRLKSKKTSKTEAVQSQRISHWKRKTSISALLIMSLGSKTIRFVSCGLKAGDSATSQ